MFLEKKMVTRRTVFGNASVRQAANQGIRRERRFEMLEVREMLAFSPLAGVNLGGASAAFADVNNDGFVDVHADALYRNNGGTSFSNIGGLGIGSWGDANNDGYYDYVMKDAPRVSLGDGNGGFVTVNLSGGFSVGPKEASTFFDLEGDGDLDVYIAGYEN